MKSVRRISQQRDLPVVSLSTVRKDSSSQVEGLKWPPDEQRDSTSLEHCPAHGAIAHVRPPEIHRFLQGGVDVCASIVRQMSHCPPFYGVGKSCPPSAAQLDPKRRLQLLKGASERLLLPQSSTTAAHRLTSSPSKALSLRSQLPPCCWP